MLQLNLLQLMQTPPPRRKAVSKSSFESTILPGNLCKSWFQLTLKQILFCVAIVHQKSPQTPTCYDASLAPQTKRLDQTPDQFV